MNKTENNETGEIGKMFFHLIEGTTIFGNVETINTERGVEILIKKPFTVVDGTVIPYMSNVLGASPGAVCIHPMNILWNVPLNEFPIIEEAYIKETTGIII